MPGSPASAPGSTNKARPHGSGSDGNELRLLADGMLGSLARKLRVFGVDTEYSSGEDDGELVRAAKAQHRTIVTADKLLATRASKAGVGCILVRGRTDAARLREVISGAQGLGATPTRARSRCSLCNGVLRSTSKKGLQGVLPPGITEHHRVFYACGHCGQIYWKGTHWKKLRGLRARSWLKKTPTDQNRQTPNVSQF
ncbi:MAG TPA: Mut7-C RNAse domain-containing protein [Nitrososphaerales archaeon]|nr:Mut7-C RNAse domain-containing protein [Nitrososphaerales archaeon]